LKTSRFSPDSLDTVGLMLRLIPLGGPLASDAELDGVTQKIINI
jgi:hypothetical protein